MASSHDDLDAVRTIVEALEPFDSTDRQRIVRWAMEKLGDSIGETNVPPAPQVRNQTQHLEPQNPVAPPAYSPTQPDIKTFVNQKKPINDMQFAATIAYYYAFEAPEPQRKEEIDSSDLQEACRLSGRERLQNPGQTLRNAAFNGLLDKGTERGSYKINTVGENLVALTLPSNESAPTPRSKKPVNKKASKKKVAKKTTKKKASAKKHRNTAKKK